MRFHLTSALIGALVGIVLGMTGILQMEVSLREITYGIIIMYVAYTISLTVYDILEMEGYLDKMKKKFNSFVRK